MNVLRWLTLPLVSTVALACTTHIYETGSSGPVHGSGGSAGTGGTVGTGNGAGGATCPPTNPGMCSPSPCINGVQRTGQASCQNGAWVCAEEACASTDATSSSSSSGCISTAQQCVGGQITTTCCELCPPIQFCDLGNGMCSLGPCTASSTGSTSSTGGPPLLCPATSPIAGQACTAGLYCTFGDDVNPLCRDAWVCTSGGWALEPSSCNTTPASQCPTTQPAPKSSCPVMGSSAASGSGGLLGDTCVYDDTICGCGCPSNQPCDPKTWYCSPTLAAGCPPIIPNDGTACTTSGLGCTYGAPCTESALTATCTSGAWNWQAAPQCL